MVDAVSAATIWSGAGIKCKCNGGRRSRRPLLVRNQAKPARAGLADDISPVYRMRAAEQSEVCDPQGCFG
jgi:hypothetical protein